MKSKLEEFVGFLEEDNGAYAYHKGSWAYKVLMKARALLAEEKAQENSTYIHAPSDTVEAIENITGQGFTIKFKQSMPSMGMGFPVKEMWLSWEKIEQILRDRKRRIT